MQVLVNLALSVYLNEIILDLCCTYHPRRSTCDRSLSFPTRMTTMLMSYWHRMKRRRRNTENGEKQREKRNKENKITILDYRNG